MQAARRPTEVYAAGVSYGAGTMSFWLGQLHDALEGLPPGSVGRPHSRIRVS